MPKFEHSGPSHLNSEEYQPSVNSASGESQANADLPVEKKNTTTQRSNLRTRWKRSGSGNQNSSEKTNQAIGPIGEGEHSLMSSEGVDVSAARESSVDHPRERRSPRSGASRPQRRSRDDNSSSESHPRRTYGEKRPTHFRERDVQKPKGLLSTIMSFLSSLFGKKDHSNSHRSTNENSSGDFKHRRQFNKKRPYRSRRSGSNNNNE